MKIVCDIDGVLADFTTAFCRVVKAEVGVDLPNPAGSWHWYREHGVTPEQEAIVWDAINRNPVFWETLPRYRWARDLAERLELLRHVGHEVFFVTHRSLGKRAKLQTELWLQRKLFYDCPTVIVDSNGKVDITRALGADVFIDDRPETCVDIKSSLPHVRVMLFKQPHNASYHDEMSTFGIPVVDWPMLEGVLSVMHAVVSKK